MTEGEEWDPEPATLREGERRDDVHGHARRNWRNIKQAEQVHRCDICDTDFETAGELFEHDCQDGDGQ